MTLNTTSETISFAKKLEEDSANFYRDLSQRYTKDGDALLSFVNENGRNIIQIERTYYGVISDALEGCFAFNVEPDEYTLKTELAEDVSYSDTLDKAVEMEEKIIKFYTDVAEQSKSLMADIPRAFRMVAKKRNNRKSKLMSLIQKEG